MNCLFALARTCYRSQRRYSSLLPHTPPPPPPSTFHLPLDLPLSLPVHSLCLSNAHCRRLTFAASVGVGHSALLPIPHLHFPPPLVHAFAFTQHALTGAATSLSALICIALVYVYIFYFIHFHSCFAIVVVSPLPLPLPFSLPLSVSLPLFLFVF